MLIVHRRRPPSSRPPRQPKSSICPAATDYAEALRTEVDAVIINSPNHLHAPQAIAAIQAGKHVLLQKKPVASSLRDAEATIAQAAAQSAGAHRSGLYMSYFDQPILHDLRDMARP